MDKAKIIESVKHDVTAIMKQLEINNIQETVEKISHYITFLESLNHILDDSDLNVENEGQMIEIRSEKEKDEGTDKGKDSNLIFPLQRKLKGGYLESPGLFVSESVIRYEGFEHGDLIQVKFENQKPHFYLSKKGPGTPMKNRRQINYALVENLNGMLVIQKEGLHDKPIKVDEVPFIFRLSEKDMEDLSLVEGDIVDLAFYENNPEQARVIWKHDTTEIIPQISSFQKKTKVQGAEEAKGGLVNIDPLLNGIAVLVVGAEMKKAEFQQKIEQHQGTFLWLEGTEDHDRLKSRVRKADVVIIVKRFMNHPKAKKIKELCKLYEVPFSEEIENFSSTKIVEEAVRIHNSLAI